MVDYGYQGNEGNCGLQVDGEGRQQQTVGEKREDNSGFCAVEKGRKPMVNCGWLGNKYAIVGCGWIGKKENSAYQTSNRAYVKRLT